MNVNKSIEELAESSTEDESDSDDEEEQLSSEFQAIPVVQQADALLNRLAARLACADRRERRASAALGTNTGEETVISYADGVGRVSHRGRTVSDELCNVRGEEYTLKVRRKKPGEKLGLVLAFDNRPASKGMPWHPPIVLELEPGAIDQPRGGAAESSLSVPSLRPGDHLLSVNGRRATATQYTSARALFAPPTEVELSLLLSRPAAPAATPATESGSEDDDDAAEGGEISVPRRLAGPLWKKCGDFFYRKREYVLDGGVLT